MSRDLLLGVPPLIALLVVTARRLRRGEARARLRAAASTASAPLQLRREPVDLAPLVRDVIGRFAPIAHAAGSTIEFDLDESAVAFTDPAATRQILLELLENAMKFATSGQRVRVLLARDATRPMTLLVVEERGDVSGQGGSRIELAGVRDLVARLNGSVWVESAGSGKGAAFVVELPSG